MLLLVTGLPDFFLHDYDCRLDRCAHNFIKYSLCVYPLESITYEERRSRSIPECYKSILPDV